jgi:hypothetical protein
MTSMDDAWTDYFSLQGIECDPNPNDPHFPDIGILSCSSYQYCIESELASVFDGVCVEYNFPEWIVRHCVEALSSPDQMLDYVTSYDCYCTNVDPNRMTSSIICTRDFCYTDSSYFRNICDEKINTCYTNSNNVHVLGADAVHFEFCQEIHEPEYFQYCYSFLYGGTFVDGDFYDKRISDSFSCEVEVNGKACSSCRICPDEKAIPSSYGCLSYNDLVSFDCSNTVIRFNTDEIRRSNYFMNDFAPFLEYGALPCPSTIYDEPFLNMTHNDTNFAACIRDSEDVIQNMDAIRTWIYGHHPTCNASGYCENPWLHSCSFNGDCSFNITTSEPPKSMLRQCSRLGGSAFNISGLLAECWEETRPTELTTHTWHLQYPEYPDFLFCLLPTGNCQMQHVDSFCSQFPLYLIEELQGNLGSSWSCVQSENPNEQYSCIQLSEFGAFSEQSSSKTLSSAAVAGIVCGVVVFVLVLLSGFAFSYFELRDDGHDDDANMPDETSAADVAVSSSSLKEKSKHGLKKVVDIPADDCTHNSSIKSLKEATNDNVMDINNKKNSKEAKHVTNKEENGKAKKTETKTKKKKKRTQDPKIIMMK